MAELTPEQKARRVKINKIVSAVTGALLIAFFAIYLLANDKDRTPVPSSAAFRAMTTEEVRAEVAGLLAELDGFRNTGEFRQCVYGCGQSNPGAVWDAKRRALQELMTPELDVPVALKAAPGELWALGMAYAKGRTDEARQVRADIEKALAQ